MSIGDIISLVTPFHTRIIVNTSELASELLDKQAAATSDRPREVMPWMVNLSLPGSQAFRKRKSARWLLFEIGSIAAKSQNAWNNLACD
ncbi:hypothetical protein FRC12_015590 [Ceratobasidium sp. 428]|nr:hypothetical protein FRC12_015590 [Ceratobasidium sp. 428]